MNKSLFLLSIISAISYTVDFNTLKENHKTTTAPAAFKLYRKKPYEHLRPPIDIDVNPIITISDKE